MMDKGLLVVSFGTSYAGTRERTIGAIERKLAERFPGRAMRRAWTSSFLIRKVAKAENLIVDTPEEALEKLAAEGVTDVIVQPTHLSDGYENQRMMEIVKSFAGRFERLAIGRPLLYTAEDRDNVARLMPQLCLAGSDDGKALLLMGHGSEKHPVPVYEQLQESFAKAGICNAFVGTVEGTPSFDDGKALLDGSGYKSVVLAPLMIVAGDHAIHDLAGEEDSWKSRLEAAGYSTDVIMAGLGEYEEIQALFAEHAEQAERI
ncbi:MAG: sirohydrochlorin cobaltochelatase [Clostridiales bacterium]|nr:sirohydrochlorin cobaltochelatase [Clostridiales bacterium]